MSTLYNFGQINGGAVLNTGLIINFGGASLKNGITLTNAFDSSIIYNAGDISLSSTSPNNGSIENLSGGSLEIEPASGSGLTNGGTLLNDAGATITNSGGLNNSSGATLTNNGRHYNGTFMNGFEMGLLQTPSYIHK